MARPKTKSRKTRALILSGGGARGAYQVGVWRYLTQKGWHPDIICGTSVGSINAVAIGSGLPLSQLMELWRVIERGSIFQVSLWRKLRNFLLRRGFTPMMDTGPLRKLLTRTVDWDHIRQSQQQIFITAVHVLSSELKFFSNQDLSVDHVMASSAIPLLFPWAWIDGEPYWDGGVMANTPILPAIEQEASEIIVVLLSPVGSDRTLEMPRKRSQVLERVFEQSLIGSYQSLVGYLGIAQQKDIWARLWRQFSNQPFRYGSTRVLTVGPKEMMGMKSILNFSSRQAKKLMEQGYQDALEQIGPQLTRN